MKSYYIVSKSPLDLTREEKATIAFLHQQFFQLSETEIIHYLQDRSYVDLFYDIQSNELIGTVGIQWYEDNGAILTYIGNAVIDRTMHGKGLLTKSIFRAVFKTILKYPFKPKYVLAFATSPKAYTYLTKYRYSWPKPFEPIPKPIYSMMNNFLEHNYAGYYQRHEHGFIVLPRTNNLKARNKATKPKRYQDAWFMVSNDEYNEGKQLACIVSVNPNNYWTLLTSFLRIPEGFKYQKTKMKLRYYFSRFKDAFYLSIIAILGLSFIFSD